MIDFICKGYLELSGARVERELQNEKFLPTVGFGPGTSRLGECATTELRGLMSVERINVHLVLNVLFLENNLQHMVDAFCKLFTLRSANFLIGQATKRYTYYTTKMHCKLFCYIYHVLPDNHWIWNLMKCVSIIHLIGNNNEGLSWLYLYYK